LIAIPEGCVRSTRHACDLLCDTVCSLALQYCLFSAVNGEICQLLVQADMKPC